MKVLQAPLPAPAPSHVLSKAAPLRQAKFDQIASLFDDVPRVDLRHGLAQLLNTSDALLPKRLDEVGDELLFHFYSDGKMRQDFRAQFQGKTPKGKAAKTNRLRAKGLPRTTGPQGLASVASSRLASHVIRRTTPNL